LHFHLNYHGGLRAITIPDKAKATVLQPGATAPVQSPADMLAGALDGARLGERLRAKAPTSIAIAISDEGQEVPIIEILPLILQRLSLALPDMEPAAVTLLVATGSHPPPGREAIQRLGDCAWAGKCMVVPHDAQDAPMADFGTTRRGTPVRVNAAFGEADFKIVIGRIEPHLFFGFTDAAKAAVIGCGSAESVRHNHGLIETTHACIGRLEGNPMREDLTEAGRLMGIDFGINVVLNPEGEAVRVLAGRPEDLLVPGAAACAAVYGVALNKKYDLVLASCADDRKDISAHQALKGFIRISPVVKKGGKILLLVASRRGFGEDVYFDYVCPAADQRLILQELNALGFTMGDRNADLFGATLTKDTPDGLEDLDTHIMEHCHLRAADPSTIMEEWVDDYEGIPEVAVIPHAMTTYFYRK
jgi:nickel-dependent lactate racemase